MQQILMCVPSRYTCSYVINPWMQPNTVNFATALSQWTRLSQLLQHWDGVSIVPIFQEDGVPDMVFTANAGLTVGDTVVLSRFKHPERQPETQIFSDVFASLGIRTILPPTDVVFEGAGDALYDPVRDIFWVGHGQRSDANVTMWLHTQFRDRVFIPLQLRSLYFYHLDTCFMPLTNGEILWFPDAFTPASASMIRSALLPGESIAVSAAAAAAFICNAVCIGNQILIPEPAVPPFEWEHAVRQLRDRGYTVQTTQLSEFLKAGGAAKCLTMNIPG